LVGKNKKEYQIFLFEKKDSKYSFLIEQKSIKYAFLIGTNQKE
jgi:hypothetical protein